MIPPETTFVMEPMRPNTELMAEVMGDVRQRNTSQCDDDANSGSMNMSSTDMLI
jgi:hypothetical protein